MAIGPAIEAALLGLVQNAGLASPMQAPNIQIGSMPEVAEQIDALPAIRIAPHGSQKDEDAGFGGQVNRIYEREIAIIDSVASVSANQALYEGWLETAKNAVTRDSSGDRLSTLSGCPTVWRIDIIDSPMFDRSKLNNLYAYLSTVVRVQSME